jgi:hypothetical protein
MKITRYFEMSGCAHPAIHHNPVGLKPQDEFYVSNESVKGEKIMDDPVVPVQGMEADTGIVV